MRKNLLLIEINECDFDFFLYGSKKYKYSSIKNYISNKVKLNTFTKDKQEGFNLDPWVQWVSVHTGKISKIHIIFFFKITYFFYFKYFIFNYWKKSITFYIFIYFCYI